MTNKTIRLEPNLTPTDLAGSAVARTALIVLRRADDEGGLKLRQTGNLSRAVLAQMVKLSRSRSDYTRMLAEQTAAVPALSSW